jgi:uncharacterized protein YjbI with pentapeptide repeats
MSENTFQALFTSDFVEGQHVVDPDLKEGHLADTELYQCAFTGGTLAASRFEHVVFEDCAFENCDLSRISLKGCRAIGVRFVGCKLLGVHFSALASNPELSFEGCDLRYAVFDGHRLKGTRWLGCKLQDASFNGCELTETDFSGSELLGAVFDGCQLAGADLSTAVDLFLDPAKNRARDAFVAVDAAVQVARSLGLRVAGYDGEKAARKKGRR